jgi:RNA-binding protein Nova
VFECGLTALPVGDGVAGKGGATIAELQQSSNTRIQLSQAAEHFPGTSDRMLLTTGGISDVLTALHLMFAKLNADAAAQKAAASGGAVAVDAEETLPLRMVVPAQACGGIIGKGGANVRHFIEDSGAGITLSHQEQQFPGVSERVITLVGKLEQQLRATALILTKMAEDSHYDPDAVPMQYALPHPGMHHHPVHAMPGVGTGRGATAAPPPPHNPYAMHMPQAGGHMGGGGSGRAHVQMAGYGGPLEKILGVADEHVGVIVGKGGRALQELQQVASVRVALSSRGEFLPGTNQRMLTISGYPQNIALAERMIEDKIAEAARLAVQRTAS